MKKLLFSLLLSVSVSSMMVFNSCQKEVTKVSTESLSVRMSGDEEVVEAYRATLNVFMAGVQNNWIANKPAIDALVTKVRLQTATPEELATLEEYVGMPYAMFESKMNDFATRMAHVAQKYPELENMSELERQAIFTKVAEKNPELLASALTLKASMRGQCPWQDLCNGIIDLAKLIGGPFLCDLIAGSVPIIGPLLCNIVLSIAADLLKSLCLLLPC